MAIFIYFVAFWKIISKRMLSIFLMHLTTIHKIKIIFAIFYIFYGVQDNYTEKRWWYLTSSVTLLKKTYDDSFLIYRWYFGCSITSKIIYFTIASLFTGEVSSEWTFANRVKKIKKRDNSAMLIYAMFLTFSQIVQN